jgi:hypothetical protein
MEEIPLQRLRCRLFLIMAAERFVSAPANKMYDELMEDL